MEKWYAVVHPGLEPVLADELRELGVTPTEEPGGASFSADLATGARIAHLARIPSRLLLQRARGPARSTEALEMLIRRAAWKPVLHPVAKREVVVSSSGSKLHFKGNVERKVEAILAELLKGPRLSDAGKRPRLTQRIQIRLLDDEAVISVDAGGDLLHRRGWRADPGPATIRESLGAALLRLSGWEPFEALLDPFCGTGTIPIEAALLATGRSPFVGRHLACTEWPALSSFKLPSPQERGAPLIVGSDREPRAITAAMANGERARVKVRWQQLDIADLTGPASVGVIVTNPPYGHRLEEDRAYTLLGRLLYSLPGWRALFVTPRPELALKVHRDAVQVAHFSNGGLRVGAWLAGDLPKKPEDEAPPRRPVVNGRHGGPVPPRR